jgi:hypothetical protein
MCRIFLPQAHIIVVFSLNQPGRITDAPALHRSDLNRDQRYASKKRRPCDQVIRFHSFFHEAIGGQPLEGKVPEHFVRVEGSAVHDGRGLGDA